MIAGVPVIESAKSRVTEPFVRVASPRKIILAFLDALCNTAGAKSFENETESRIIDIAFPSLRLGALLQSVKLRVQPGPATACGGRNSSGEATSAGAVNSQRTLHAANAKRR